MYKDWEIIECNVFRKDNCSDFVGNIRLSKSFVIKEFYTYTISFSLDSEFYSKQFHTGIEIGIVSKFSITTANPFTKKTNININIANPKQLEDAVRGDCKKRQIDKLKPFLDRIDDIVNSYIAILHSSTI